MNSYSSSEYPIPRPEDAEEWKSPSFSGDFYREADNVCRGVTMPPSDVPGPHSYKDFGTLDGDYYREPDDLVKGISVCGGGSSFAPSPFAEFGLSSNHDYSSTLKSKIDVVDERFQAGDAPPSVPSDSFFTLEVTTLYASCHSPFVIGNSLLDFLATQVVSTLTKVRRAKFSMKADAFVDNMMCTMKIRVYSQISGQYAIEFQKRSGDGIAFGNIFQKATAYLQSQPHLSLRPTEVTTQPISFQPLPLPADLVEYSIGEEDILPIVNMAGLVDAPWLQVEAATTLGNMAAEGKPVIRSNLVFQGIGELMQSSSTDVSLPTSRLISHLAQQGEAASLFASHGLLPKILAKVHAQETNAQIRRQYAQSLYSASQLQSAATLPQSDAVTLIRNLSEALCTIDTSWGSEVTQNLELAKISLSSTFQILY